MRRNLGKFSCLLVALCLALGWMLAPVLAAPAPEESEFEGYLIQMREEPTQSAAFGRTAPEMQLRKVGGAELLYAADCIEATQLYVRAGMVEEIYPNYRVELLELPEGQANLLSLPNDEFYGKQWYLDAIGAPQAWDIAPALTGEGIRVAVIDSGVSASHPELIGRVVEGKDYTAHRAESTPGPCTSHGTQVAGIIAATVNNGIGVAGIVPDVTIVSQKVFYLSNGAPSALVEDVIPALYDAVDLYDCDILNMSFGFKTVGNGPYTPVTNALEYAASKGVLLVAAVGNDGGKTEAGGTAGMQLQYRPVYPAANSIVAGVAASGSNGRVAAFSQRNNTALLTAPGISIYNTVYFGGSNGYGSAEGTSLAAPQVVAAGVLLKQRYPDITQLQFMELLGRTATPFSGGGSYDQYGGAGILNLAALLQVDLYSFGAAGGPYETLYWTPDNAPVSGTVCLLAAGYDADNHMVASKQYTVRMDDARDMILWIAPMDERVERMWFLVLDPVTWTPVYEPRWHSSMR